MEGHREVLQVETPTGTSVGLLRKNGATEAVLDFLKSTSVGCLETLRWPPEEKKWEDSECER